MSESSTTTCRTVEALDNCKHYLQPFLSWREYLNDKYVGKENANKQKQHQYNECCAIQTNNKTSQKLDATLSDILKQTTTDATNAENIVHNNMENQTSSSNNEIDIMNTAAKMIQNRTRQNFLSQIDALIKEGTENLKRVVNNKNIADTVAEDATREAGAATAKMKDADVAVEDATREAEAATAKMKDADVAVEDATRKVAAADAKIQEAEEATKRMVADAQWYAQTFGEELERLKAAQGGQTKGGNRSGKRRRQTIVRKHQSKTSPARRVKYNLSKSRLTARRRTTKQLTARRNSRHRL